MSDHTRFEELAALAETGELGDEELNDLQRHAETCAQCEKTLAEFRELVHFGLPTAESPVRRHIHMILHRPYPGATQRFLRRASLEGIAFSQDVRGADRYSKSHLGIATATAGALAAIAIAFLYGAHRGGGVPVPSDTQNLAQTQQRLDQLTRQNSALDVTISQQARTLTEQQRETESLRAQVASLNSDADSSRRLSEQRRAEGIQSASRNAQSLEQATAQLKVQEKLLADTRAELAQVNQTRESDQASIVADQAHINELSQQLKDAKANVDMERQLAGAGKDVRDLMGARQLHVVDVRDTDPNGKAGKAFGRVFLTEGKSLIFYAFDLTDAKKTNAKQTFQVWGQQEGKASSLRSLGFLYVDDKTQRRWALKTDDPAAVKEIDSVFVTVEPAGGAKKPGSQRLLYAYLGEANHP
jgi:hypothetical protein